MEYIEVYPVAIQHGGSENESYILILEEPVSGLGIPMLIGSQEAQSIILAQEETHVNRPMTHTFICSIMDEFHLEFTHVTIDKFNEGIFYATAYISDVLAKKQIDCRPSDAIVLAIKKRVPIWVEKSILAETGVEMNVLQGEIPKEDNYAAQLEELKRKLKEAEDNEEYEEAASIQQIIDMMIKEHNEETSNNE